MKTQLVNKGGGDNLPHHADRKLFLLSSIGIIAARKERGKMNHDGAGVTKWLAADHNSSLMAHRLEGI